MSSSVVSSLSGSMMPLKNHSRYQVLNEEPAGTEIVAPPPETAPPTNDECAAVGAPDRRGFFPTNNFYLNLFVVAMTLLFMAGLIAIVPLAIKASKERGGGGDGAASFIEGPFFLEDTTPVPSSKIPTSLTKTPSLMPTSRFPHSSSPHSQTMQQPDATKAPSLTGTPSLSSRNPITNNPAGETSSDHPTFTTVSSSYEAPSVIPSANKPPTPATQGTTQGPVFGVIVASVPLWNQPSSAPSLSTAPSDSPSKPPTKKPTVGPTNPPSRKPTRPPTIAPSEPFIEAAELLGTPQPTPWPTQNPTPAPSKTPTKEPTPFPTPQPTEQPTIKPTTQEPTAIPTLDPWTITTPRPTTRPPTMIPSSNPTLPTTKSPSSSPSFKPVNSPPPGPTDLLLAEPTVPPTFEPTVEPTFEPKNNKDKNKDKNKDDDDEEEDQTEEPTTLSPSMTPSETPSFAPTVPPGGPTKAPTNPPTPGPTQKPTNRPTPPTDTVTFIPGLLTVEENGLLLSTGLTARLLAEEGETVKYDQQTGMGNESLRVFHGLPDAGATFQDPSPTNPGGWIYVSNSEEEDNDGGVGAITFDSEGRIIKYEMLLTGTSWNCGGGKTPWNTWISCEESGDGSIYQVDPTGQREPEVLTMGSEGGSWESFAYDIRDPNRPRFFVTEDEEDGVLQRFTPNITDWSNEDAMWNMLHGPGVIEYLLLQPDMNDESKGTYSWGTDKDEAKDSAEDYYPHTEGIDIHDGVLYFVCKEVKMMFELNLDTMQYTRHSTESGIFDGEPDQLKRILTTSGETFLFFTEDGGDYAGVHGRDENGVFFTVLESEEYDDETTGLAFSPDYRYMYIAYQDNGLLFEVSRLDGHSFGAKSLDVKYHAATERNMNRCRNKCSSG